MPTQEKAPSAAAEKEPEAWEESPSEEEPAASSPAAVETKEGGSEAVAGDGEPREDGEEKADYEAGEQKEGKATEKKDSQVRRLIRQCHSEPLLTSNQFATGPRPTHIQRNLRRVVYSRAKRQPDLKDQNAEGEGTSKTIDCSKRPKFSKPQMDKNTCSGDATDSDSELSLTACLNRFSLLQSSPSPPSSTTRESSTAPKRRKVRKRTDKQRIIETPSPSSAVNEDQPEPELSSSVSDSDDVPRLQPVGERSSSPGLMQPEAPVEKLEAQPTPTTSEPELPLPATLSTSVNLPLAAANSGECPSDRESVTCNLSSAEEQEPSVAPPRPPSTDEPLLDAPTTLAALSLAAPEDLNGLAESRTELETASHEPSLMPPAEVQPQASSPEASTETVPPDMRPQVAVPALLPDLDAKRTLESSTAQKRRKGRKRNNKQMISATSSAVNEDQPEPELSSSVSDSDDVPKVQPVGERSSSPGLVQPEAPVERLEAQPTPTTSEPELPLPATLSTRVNLPLAAANSGECPSDRESVTCNLSSAEEQEPSVAPPRPPSRDEPLLDAPRTLAALSLEVTEDLNGLAESRTELETASHEPSLMPPAALAQPQASSPEASTETVPPDMRPQVAVPALLPDLDVKRTLESSTAPKRRKVRKRNNKQMISATSSAVNEDQPEPELSSSVSDSDDVPRLQPVGERSSSPGLMQPEAPVERLEAQPTPTTSELELPLPATLSTHVNLPLAAANSGECPSDRESVTCNLSSAEEQEPSVAPPRPPSRDEPLLDAPKTLAALSLAAPEDLNGLAESRTELETASHEPSLMPPAALQPQASSPEASTETVPPDMRPQVAVSSLLPDLDAKRTLETQKSSSPYLRELMSAVCKLAVKENTTCRVHAALLQRRMPVTLEYRYSERERQMKALRELQSLIVALDQPPDLLRIFFHCMYDKDVSSKDTYCKSGAGKELADQLGNGVALETVTAFFTWLREAESQHD